MVTKNEIKFIKSLRSKSIRDKFNLFVVEGKKSINEFLNSDYKVYKIYSTHPANISYTDVIQISDKQLIQISALKTPNKHIAILFFGALADHPQCRPKNSPQSLPRHPPLGHSP